MNQGVYSILLKSPTGAFVARLDDFHYLQMARKVNEVGRMTLVVSPNWPIETFGQDQIIEVWRIPKTGASAYLELGTVWFLISARKSMNEHGKYEIKIRAKDALTLLERRVSAYRANDANSKVAGVKCDNAMKRLVRSNYLAVAGSYFANPDPVRDLSGYLTVEPDNAGSTHPVIEKEYAHAEVLSTVKYIADYSAENNVPLAFDIVPTAFNGTAPFLEFRTYTGQLGTDRTNSVMVSPEKATLSNAAIEYSWEDTYNRVYAAGQGEDAARAMALAADAARITATPFSLREKFRDARHVSTPAALQTEADTFLKIGEPVITISGKIEQNPSLLYGVDVFYGDKVGVYFDGVDTTGYINAVSFDIDHEGHEKIDLYLSTELGSRRLGIDSVVTNLARLEAEIKLLQQVENA